MTDHPFIPVLSAQVLNFGEPVFSRIPEKQTTTMTSMELFCGEEALPAEILSYIFQLCFPGKILLPPKRNGSPLLLCHVCSRWRQVALRTLTLWNNVHLIILTTTYPHRTEELVLDWFSRAGDSCPFDFKVSTQGFTYASIFQAVINTFVIPNATRFRRLDLTGPAQILIPFLDSPGSSFTSVEHLRLAQDGIQTFPRVRNRPVTLFDGCPSLREVILGPFYNYGSETLSFMDQVYLPWSQLTKLDFSLTECSPSTCHTILSQCNRLVECSLPFLKPTPVARQPTPIHLPYLRSLSFRTSSHDGTIDQLIRPLIAPQLQVLKIYAEYNFVWAHHSYAAFIQRSGCKLLSLSLINTYLEATQLYEALSLSPTLRELHLGRMAIFHRSYLWGNVIRGLAESVLLPELKVLTARLTSSLDDTLEMVEVRAGMREGSNDARRISLVRVVLGCEQELTDALTERIENIRRTGVDLKVSPLSEIIPVSESPF